MITRTHLAGLGRAGLLLCTLGVPGTLLQAATQTTATVADEQQALRRFDIPAQPLSSALISFGRQSGLQISVDSQLLRGLQAPAVRGELPREQALERLLQDSGLVWHYSGAGTVLLEAPARSEAATVQLGSTHVSGRSQGQGEMLIGRKQIEALPAGNGDITSLLKIHPNVQFDNNQLSSKRPGEIDPADISINGARPWQNLFILDGMSMNNDIDPAQTSETTTETAGRSQGLAIDTDLLGGIKVYDSNVPAAYGGFNGGVIEATTRAPSKELRGRVSAQMTRSSWTRYHIDENDAAIAEFEAAVGNGNQPEFDKITYRSTLEGHLTENFGLIGSFARKQATIPTRTFTLGHQTTEARTLQDQERRIDNYFLKANWAIRPDLLLETSITHAPEKSVSYGSNARNSYRETYKGGDSISTRLSWDAPLAKVEQLLSWNRLENSRTSDVDYMRIWRSSSSQNWSGTTSASEGSFGSIEQEQETLSYKLIVDWTSFSTWSLEHNLQTGMELAHTKVHFERLRDYYSNALAATASTTWCAASDPWCSVGQVPSNGWPGQYIRTYTLAEAGTIDFQTRSWAIFLQDEMRYRNLSLRPGVRVDADSYMDKTTVAPRLALDYDIFGDGQTRLHAGANRYHGRNLYTYRLREEMNAMQVSYSRANQNSPWAAGARTVNNAKFNRLDIPYDDELTLGLTHIAWSTEFALKYVNRKGRDQISRAWGQHIGQPSTDPSQLTANYYTYYNGGESEADIYTFTITPLQDVHFWGTRNTGQMAFDWSDVNSSGLSDYTSNIGLIYVNAPIIQYAGQFISYADRPANNYNRPWTLRLTSITEIPRWNLTWSNFWRYRDGYRKIGATGAQVSYNGENIRVWDEMSYPAALTWDTRLGWELPTAQDQAAFINLDVTNLLDKRIASNAGSEDSLKTTDVPSYEIGRQFTLEVGYRF